MKGKASREKRIAGYLTAGAAVALVVFTFTPVILHPGKIEPRLLSMPFTLWTSILITIVLVVLTFLASRFRDRE